jgi:glycosyltransferase involved in cell wall biosynthesis
MRIGIDYTAAVRQGGGIGRYTRSLVGALARLDVENEYRLFYASGGLESGHPRAELARMPESFRARPVPLSDRWLNIAWQRLRLPVPLQLVTGRLDLFHSPDFVLPHVGRTPAILTVHDLSFLRVPWFFVPGFREYLEKAVTRAVGRATHILADSESTRRDMIELMAVDDERVSVVYPGVDAGFQETHDPEELQRVRRRYDLPERFILGLGTLQPRKNFDGLVNAFGLLLSRGKDEPGIDGLHLVIVGGKGWMFEDIHGLVRKQGLEERVHFAGFVDDSDLPALYSLSLVFAFPSWYEGFGIPVLEAMACGTPVVAADNSSLPEAVGEAGVLVDAASNGDLADALARLLSDLELRRRLAVAGRQQAQRFTWERAAEQVLGIYRSCA